MDYYIEQPPKFLAEYGIEFFKIVATKSQINSHAHIHMAVEFLYITEGEFRLEIDGKQFSAHAGDIALFCSNSIHSVYHFGNEPGSYYVLKLPADTLFQNFKGGDNADCIYHLLKSGNHTTFFNKSMLTHNIHAVWRAMIDEYTHKNPGTMSMIKSYAFVFCIELYRIFFADAEHTDSISVSRDLTELIHKSIEYINNNYASDITAEICARNVGLSYSYYARLFQLVTGKNFKEYLIGLRLAKAHGILLATDLPVTDVALSCGYKSPAYFTAEYKKRYGTTPSATRK